MAAHDASDDGRDLVSTCESQAAVAAAVPPVSPELLQRAVRLQKALELAREPVVLWRARVLAARGPVRFAELVRIGRDLYVTELTSARAAGPDSDIRRRAPPDLADDEVADVIVASLPTRLTEWIRWHPAKGEYILPCSTWSANADVLRFMRARFRGLGVRADNFNTTLYATDFVWRRDKPVAAAAAAKKRPREQPT